MEYKCSVCTQPFNTSDELVGHMMEQHAEIKESGVKSYNQITGQGEAEDPHSYNPITGQGRH